MMDSQITIDTSPPVAGTVHDGPGPHDIDYQQSLTLHTTWHHFFDRESGVAFYQFAFGAQCLEADDFGLPPQEGVRYFHVFIYSFDVHFITIAIYYVKHVKHNMQKNANMLVYYIEILCTYDWKLPQIWLCFIIL